jgi:hypothetical protein
MHLSPRCGARSKRTGEPCRSAAMKNGRCRMHGGKSSGAPKGNQNALKHGNYTAAAQAALREKKREIRRILEIERRKFRELPEEWADMQDAEARLRRPARPRTHDHSSAARFRAPPARLCAAGLPFDAVSPRNVYKRRAAQAGEHVFLASQRTAVFGLSQRALPGSRRHFRSAVAQEMRRLPHFWVSRRKSFCKCSPKLLMA